MKPKTKIQIAVYDLAKKLPRLTKDQENYAVSKLFDKRCYATKSSAFCLECGNDIDITTISRKRITCSECGSRLKVVQTRKKTHSSGPCYFAVTSLIKYGIYDFQLVRTFEFRRHYRKGKKANLYAVEVCQNWYNIDGKEVIYSRLINGYQGSFAGDMEIRVPSHYKSYDITPDIYCPTSEFRPEYVKRGISSKILNISLKDIVNEVHYSQIETLLKAGYYHILYNWKPHSVIQYWDTLKICIRNKYKITKPTLYKDLLDALRYLNKDLRNPHYVCPKNLLKAHDYYIQKKTEVEIGKTIAANMKKAQENNPKYIKEKQKFFQLEFAKNGIKIQPLKSVPEFLAEGEYLKHCVFKGGYYNRKESLILSARIKNKPVETIEISLKDFKVVQCYGMNNKESKHHEEILNLVKSNIPKIKQLISA